MEGNLRFKIDWASLIVGRKSTVFVLFYFVYLKGLFNGGFFALRVWGAYTRRGLFSEFYGILITLCVSIKHTIIALTIYCTTLLYSVYY